jgi:hypothetical protein
MSNRSSFPNSGVVYLYHKGKMLRQKYYRYGWERQSVIKEWRKLYGQVFEKAEIRDSPGEAIHGKLILKVA